MLALPRTLLPTDWDQPTACTGWTVKDVVAHLPGGHPGRLLFGRDRLQRQSTDRVPTSNAELIAMINDQNARWVEAARQISPPLLIDFLAMTDQQVAAYFASLLHKFESSDLGTSLAGA